jgi:hypothetical protein
MNFA